MSDKRLFSIKKSGFGMEMEMEIEVGKLVAITYDSSFIIQSTVLPPS
jgi:hypothetical protein